MIISWALSLILNNIFVEWNSLLRELISHVFINLSSILVRLVVEKVSTGLDHSLIYCHLILVIGFALSLVSMTLVFKWLIHNKPFITRYFSFVDISAHRVILSVWASLLNYCSGMWPQIVSWSAWYSSSSLEELPLNRLHQLVIWVGGLEGEVINWCLSSLNVSLAVDVLLIIIHVYILDDQFIIGTHVLILSLVHKTHVLKRHVVMLDNLRTNSLLLQLLETLA